MLVELCEKTEPEIPTDTYLFSGQLIAAQEMVKRVSVKSFGADLNEQMELMREANKIWKMRNKWDK
jgi:hypothetical protein